MVYRGKFIQNVNHIDLTTFFFCHHLGNSSGDIDMWDLLHSMDEPLVSVTQESLTKLAWYV